MAETLELKKGLIIRVALKGKAFTVLHKMPRYLFLYYRISFYLRKQKEEWMRENEAKLRREGKIPKKVQNYYFDILMVNHKLLLSFLFFSHLLKKKRKRKRALRK